jgi:UDP:flavonoid glycosyltransferase YjiC (YdhE family)
MRFLFCSLDSPGFLYPSIGIARSLRSRGHEIAFATNLQHAGLLAGQGFERLPRGPVDGSSFQVAQWGLPVPIAIQVKHVEHALELFPADALFGQSLTLGPLIVAAQRGLPVGLLGFCTYLWPTTEEGAEHWGEIETSLHSPVEEWRAWRYVGVVEALDKARALFRLPPLESRCRETPLLADLFLLRSVPDLEPAWENLPERVHLVGSCLWEPEDSDPDLETWLAESARAGSPLIYAQPGRSFHLPSFWRELIDGLGGGGYRVAASTGRLDGEIGAVPESFFVRPHIPQGRILRSARVAVASANSTAVLGALAAGVPSLLIPGGGEQPDVAALCESAGVARTLPPAEATPERIHAEIRILLADSSYRENARRYQAAFAALDGSERAADLLEILARTRRPVLRDFSVKP